MQLFNALTISVANARVKVERVRDLTLKLVTINMKLRNGKCQAKDDVKLDKGRKMLDALKEMNGPLACYII